MFGPAPLTLEIVDADRGTIHKINLQALVDILRGWRTHDPFLHTEGKPVRHAVVDSKVHDILKAVAERCPYNTEGLYMKEGQLYLQYWPLMQISKVLPVTVMSVTNDDGVVRLHSMLTGAEVRG